MRQRISTLIAIAIGGSSVIVSILFAPIQSQG
jgi:hypothetical protein